jgi:hypothetical protein
MAPVVNSRSALTTIDSLYRFPAKRLTALFNIFITLACIPLHQYLYNHWVFDELDMGSAADKGVQRCLLDFEIEVHTSDRLARECFNDVAYHLGIDSPLCVVRCLWGYFNPRGIEGGIGVLLTTDENDLLEAAQAFGV